MNLQDETITTLKEALDKFKKGKMTRDDFMAHISAANTFHKLISGEIQSAMIYENQRKVYNVLERKGIVDATSHLDIGGDTEADKVKCPEHDNLITRAECLDFSGSHIDECIWRCHGGGPVYVKLGKAVRYRQSDIDDFIKKNVKTNTGNK